MSTLISYEHGSILYFGAKKLVATFEPRGGEGVWGGEGGRGGTKGDQYCLRQNFYWRYKQPPCISQQIRLGFYVSNEIRKKKQKEKFKSGWGFGFFGREEVKKHFLESRGKKGWKKEENTFCAQNFFGGEKRRKTVKEEKCAFVLLPFLTQTLLDQVYRYCNPRL